MERPEEVKLYSYAVEHDTGYGPNPYFRFCTLCGCKFRVGRILFSWDALLRRRRCDQRKNVIAGRPAPARIIAA